MPRSYAEVGSERREELLGDAGRRHRGGARGLRVEIRLHAFRVDDERGGDAVEEIQRRAELCRDVGDGGELGLPTAQRALVLRDRGGVDRGEQPRHARAGGERVGTADGIALVGHGARRAHARARGRLEHLAHLGLHHQRYVARDLRGGGDRLADAIQEIDPCIAMHVPRRHVGEAEMHRDAMAYRRALRSERLERTDGPAELHGERGGLRIGEPVAVVGEGERPARELDSRRDRQGRLHEGSPHHRRGGAPSRRGSARRSRGCDRLPRGTT
jgi:hypothetical protein